MSAMAGVNIENAGRLYGSKRVKLYGTRFPAIIDDTLTQK